MIRHIAIKISLAIKLNSFTTPYCEQTNPYQTKQVKLTKIHESESKFIEVRNERENSNYQIDATIVRQRSRERDQLDRRGN